METTTTFTVIPTTHMPLCLESAKNSVKETYMYNVLTGVGVKEQQAKYIAYTGCDCKPPLTISQFGAKVFNDMPISTTLAIFTLGYLFIHAISKIKITIR